MTGELDHHGAKAVMEELDRRIDVYKRQAMIMARSTKLSVFDEPEAGIDLWSFSNLIQVFEHLHETVSYTHLDVYKRQGPAWTVN